LNELHLKRMKEFKKPRLSKDDWYKFIDAEKCHFCRKEFTDKDAQLGSLSTDIKVRDHCHIIGDLRGADHQSCNLKVRTSLKIPVFFHNGFGCDFKHFVRKLYKFDRNLRIISQTEEKYFSITVKASETNISF
jgi:hypothetical protein